MKSQDTYYTDRSPWPGFAYAILWGAIALCAYPLLAGWDTDLPLDIRLFVVLGIVLSGAAAQVVLGGLTVRVQETRLFVHLGRVPLVRKVVPYDEILSLKSVTYSPLREFGGWGVRGFGRRRAWTARGSHAVALELTGDRELLVGSDYPRRLEERIRTTAGEQLRGA